ncbi:MAG: hypothetical protein ACR2HG_01080 [Pyrinomonadaceae bacterium]
MPEKTKQKEDSENHAEDEKSFVEDCEIDKKGNWSEDQKEKSYYYDDAYGYEIYNPDEDDDE